MGTTLMDEPRPRGSKTGTTLMGARGGTRLISIEGSDHDQVNEDPVVGWLVVVEGPGRGYSVELGFGMNIIGRGRGNRIVLDFGDDKISEEDHFRIAYDPKHRTFHLIPGRGTNLVYVEGSPLLTPQAVTTGTNFQVGDTGLRFVALCGPDWEWETEQKAEG